MHVWKAIHVQIVFEGLSCTGTSLEWRGLEGWRDKGGVNGQEMNNVGDWQTARCADCQRMTQQRNLGVGTMLASVLRRM